MMMSLARIVLWILFSAIANTIYAINVVATNNADTLAASLLGPGITLVNATYTGNAAAAGTYTNGPLKIANGIVLTSGSAAAVSEAQSNTASASYNVAGSPLCSGVAPGSYFDSALLTMYIKLDLDSYNGMTTNFIFGSDEYPTFVGQKYNDAVGIYFDGVQYAFDSAHKPVNINNGFFAPGTVVTATGTVYGGSTPLLQLNSPDLSTAEIHRIDMVVCDAGDAAYDSGALISAFSGVMCSGVCTGGAVLSGPVISLSPASDSGISQTDSITNAPSLTIVGQAAENKVVTISLNGTAIGAVDSGASGKFTYTLPNNLPYGDIVVVATAVSGTKSASSTPIVIKYRPYATAILDAGLDSSTDTGLVGDSVTTTSSPVISGTFLPNTPLTVSVNNQTMIVPGTDSDGHFSFQIDPSVRGPVQVLISGADLAGNVVSKIVNITIAPKPGSPVIDGLSPATDSGFKGDGITTDTNPIILGSAEPNSAVTLYVDGVKIGSGLSNDNGAFSIPVSLNSGETSGVYAIATTSVDNSAPSSPFVVTVRPATAATPSDLALDDNSDSGTKGDSTTTSSTPKIDGKGVPGQLIQIYVDNGTSVATTTVAQDGTFQVELPMLSNGMHSITASATDIDGNISGISIPLTLKINASKAVTPELKLDPTITYKSSSQTLSKSPNILGTLPGSNNSTSSVGPLSVTLILDGTTIVTVPSDGFAFNYQYQDLALGDHTVTAYTTDADGNTSPESSPYKFQIIMIPLTVHTGTSNSDPTNMTSIPVLETTGLLPLFTGTGMPGSTIDLILDNTPLTSVIVDVDGLWSYQTTVPLSPGLHTLVVNYGQANDDNGSQSASVSFLAVAPVVSTSSEAPTTSSSAFSSTLPTTVSSTSADSTSSSARVLSSAVYYGNSSSIMAPPTSISSQIATPTSLTTPVSSTSSTTGGAAVGPVVTQLTTISIGAFVTTKTIVITLGPVATIVPTAGVPSNSNNGAVIAPIPGQNAGSGIGASSGGISTPPGTPGTPPTGDAANSGSSPSPGSGSTVTPAGVVVVDSPATGPLSSGTDTSSSGVGSPGSSTSNGSNGVVAVPGSGNDGGFVTVVNGAASSASASSSTANVLPVQSKLPIASASGSTVTSSASIVVSFFAGLATFFVL